MDCTFTLWLWPTGLYPSRVLHYLKAKQLSPSVLDKMHIIPEKLQGTGISPIRGLEQRPAGFSLPCLAVHRNGNTSYITQASAIVEFLEDAFTPHKGFRSLRGVDAVETGRVRDAINLTNEAVVSIGFYVRHEYAWTTSWSGMTDAERSASAAADALRETKRRLATLERCCGTDEDGRPWVAKTGEPTLADFTLFGAVEYVLRLYGFDMLEGFPSLLKWREACRRNEVFATVEDMDALEAGQGLAWAPIGSERIARMEHVHRGA